MIRPAVEAMDLIDKINHAWVKVLRTSGYLNEHNETVILKAVDKEVNK